jgi:MFS transporter, Spinster family, sphingosine-1-phosphate transporter
MASAPGNFVPSRAAYWTLAALFGMNLLNFVDRYILAAVLKPMQADAPVGLGLNDAQAGSVQSVFYITYALISPVIGWLGDRVPRKYVLAASVGLWSLATFCSGLARSYPEMLLARAVLAVGEATYTALAATLIADLFPRQQRGWALTFFYLAVPLGAAVGYPLGGFVSAGFGWRTAFYVVGLPGLAVALAALALREPQRGATEAMTAEQLRRQQAMPFSWQIYGSLVRNRSFFYNALAMAMFTFALGGLQVWAPKYFAGLPGLDLESANFYLGIVLVVSGIVGTSLGGWLAERLARRWQGAYFWLSGLTLLGSVPFILIALGASHPAVIFPALLVGLILAFMNIGPSNTIIANVAPPKIRAGAVAINLFVTRVLGDIPSPTLMGLVSDSTGHLFWGVALAIPALIAAGVFFCLGGPHLQDDQEAVLKGIGVIAPVDEPVGPLDPNNGAGA